MSETLVDLHACFFSRFSSAVSSGSGGATTSGSLGLAAAFFGFVVDFSFADFGSFADLGSLVFGVDVPFVDFGVALLTILIRGVLAGLEDCGV